MTYATRAVSSVTRSFNYWLVNRCNQRAVTILSTIKDLCKQIPSHDHKSSVDLLRICGQGSRKWPDPHSIILNIMSRRMIRAQEVVFPVPPRSPPLSPSSSSQERRRPRNGVLTLGLSVDINYYISRWPICGPPKG